MINLYRVIHSASRSIKFIHEQIILHQRDNMTYKEKKNVKLGLQKLKWQIFLCLTNTDSLR